MKSCVLRFLRNLAVLNAFIAVPAVIFWTGFFPEKIEVEVSSDKPGWVSVCKPDERLISRESMPGSGKGVVVSTLLPRSAVDWRNALIEIDGVDDFELCSVSVIKGGMFSFSFSGDVAAKAFQKNRTEHGGESRVVITANSNASFLSAKFGLGHHPKRALSVLAMELLLLAMSVVGAAFKNKRAAGWKWAYEWLIAVGVFTLYYACVVPVQSYIANMDLFQFSGWELAKAVSIRFAYVFAFLAIAVACCARCFGGRVCAAFLLALVFCGYLETGPLAAGLPSLDGNMEFYARASGRCLVDCGILAVVFAIVSSVVIWVRNGAVWTAAAIVLLVAASFADVKVPQKPDVSAGCVSDFKSKCAIARNVKYSSTGHNVLVFVLDALTSEAAHDAFEQRSDLRKMFSGFVEYPRNVGMYGFTHPGVAGIMTGRYLENVLRPADYYFSIFSSHSALKNALDAGMSVYFMPGSYTFGYTNASLVNDDEESSKKESPFSGHIEGLQAWCLDEVSIFRLTPFCMKPFVHSIVECNWDSDNIGREFIMYNLLENGSVVNQPSTFLLAHTDGTHVPIQFTESGEFLKTPALDYNGYLGQAKFVLWQLGRLLEVYREKGIYDNSTIIVLADHGAQATSFRRGGGDELPVGAIPCLLVKAAGATNEFYVSSAATSHSRVAGLLKKLFETTLTADEITEYLECDNREFRVEDGGQVTVYTAKRNGVVSCQIRNQNMDTMRPVRVGMRHFLGPDESNPIDVQRENVGIGHIGLYVTGGSGSKAIAFKVDEANRAYNVVLGVKVDESLCDGHMVLSAGSARSDVALRLGVREVALKNVRPDASGIIRIDIIRTGRGGAYITDIQIQ